MLLAEPGPEEFAGQAEDDLEPELLSGALVAPLPIGFHGYTSFPNRYRRLTLEVRPKQGPCVPVEIWPPNWGAF